MVTVLRPLHPSKAYSPMFTTPSGITKPVTSTHPLKAYAGMFVTLLLMVIVLRLMHPKNTGSADVPMLLQLAALKSTFSSATQLSNAELSMLKTLLPIVTFLRATQFSKRPNCSSCTLLPITAVFKFWQPENTPY